jgi:hypothetical protein
MKFLLPSDPENSPTPVTWGVIPSVHPIGGRSNERIVGESFKRFNIEADKCMEIGIHRHFVTNQFSQLIISGLV